MIVIVRIPDVIIIRVILMMMTIVMITAIVFTWESEGDCEWCGWTYPPWRRSQSDEYDKNDDDDYGDGDDYDGYYDDDCDDDEDYTVKKYSKWVLDKTISNDVLSCNMRRG